jgi:uncharacterized protein YbjT (DUF2867 family)
MPHAILLTGATGYIGGRLLRLLEETGHQVRCLVRRPALLQGRISSSTGVLRGDVLDSRILSEAMRGVDTAYYMVHSMSSSLEDFEELDRQAAIGFGRAAKEAGVRRIIYLGGLGDSSTELSPHLRSRQLVGELLATSGVPVIEFRASIVIGSGSLSFELVRALAERLPVLLTPRWVKVKAQPIAIGDVLEYLTRALEIDAAGHRIFEIGGADQAAYVDIIREYARQRHIRRIVISLPVLTPRLSSLWLGLVTPVYARIGRKLIDSITHPTVVRDRTALGVFPVQPKGIAEAIAEALRNEDREFTETHWWHSLAAGGPPAHWGGVRFGNRLVYHRRVAVNASAAEAFDVIRRIGGANGWYYANWLWGVRGFLDLLVGGVGVRRGRRHPSELCIGDVIDWWRVERYNPGESLRLYAEMKVPGRAWLELSVEDLSPRPEIVQTAIFDPVGVLGLAYWYGIYPLHALVFRGMLREMSRAAESAHSRSTMLPPAKSD